MTTESSTVKEVVKMPTSTFFNLADEKREGIIQAAIDEFAVHSYHKSSINQIVKKADIAKGSFYHYFKDKEDLFKYILEVAGKKKLEYLDHVLSQLDKLSFSKVIHELYSAGVKFGQNNPKLQSIGAHFIKAEDNNLKKEIFSKNEDLSNSLFKELLAKGVNRGEIDPQINIDLVAFMLTRFSISLTEYYLDQQLKIRENEMIHLDNSDEIMEIVDDMLYIVMKGVQNKKD